MSNEDDREMRAKSEDNDRFAGDKKRPAPLHSKEANTRMGGGGPGQDGSRSMADDEITLAGHGPDGGAADVSKQDEDGGVLPDRNEGDGMLSSDHDVDQIAEDLLQLDDEDTARAVARVIVRTGDVVGDLAASLEDGGVTMNDRMNQRAD